MKYIKVTGKKIAGCPEGEEEFTFFPYIRKTSLFAKDGKIKSTPMLVKKIGDTYQLRSDPSRFNQERAAGARTFQVMETENQQEEEICFRFILHDLA